MIARSIFRHFGIAALFLTPCLSASAQQAGQSPVKIFLMIGQSNTQGHGEIAPAGTPGTLEHVVANDPEGNYQFLVDGVGDWIELEDAWIHYERSPGNLYKGGVTTGYGANSSGTTIGPELGFGHHAAKIYEEQVLIVKCAWGGKSLGNDFLPPSSGPYAPPTQAGDPGFYYQEVLRLVNDATTNLATHFPDYNGEGYEIAGICWHQGWNDRATEPYADAYEVNMVNFINDIRDDLGVPNLPFVIATTGMDGSPDVYSKVEIAQLKMNNSTGEHPAFAGNVAVIDTRSTYPYDNGMTLEFWQPVSESPQSEGHHWNRNAKTYLHIGLAQGDAMSTLLPPRCPSRLRASSDGSGGVALSWQNGSETPTSVRILRDGVEIAAAAPVVPSVFSDTTAEPGDLEYELVFNMPGDPCPPMTLTYQGGITGLEGFRLAGGVRLHWANNMVYDGIEIRRNGAIIEASLSGDATSYTDASAPASGTVTYAVVPTNGGATPATLAVNLDGAPFGNALVYEPFDYPVGDLADRSGISEVGLEGVWAANADSEVLSGSLGHGALPVAGNSFGPAGVGNRFGAARAIRPSALAENGLLDDNAVLWFSVIVGYQSGSNGSNARLAFALANNSFSRNNYNYSIVNGGTGSGLGLSLGNFSGSGKVVATSFGDGGSGLDSNVFGTVGGSLFTDGQHGLIVGRIAWGADTDRITLYAPGTDLSLPAVPISTLAVDVDQAGYDTITWARSDLMVLDEIRFGADYSDVVAGIIPPDITPPTPNPAAFASPPASAGETAITMTAQTGGDASGGVEYFFTETSGQPGGSNSEWQTSPSYTDTGLDPGTAYSYTVTIRDLMGNAGTPSASLGATTDVPDVTAPTPNPMTWASPPAAAGVNAITMTASTASDISGVEYYFTCSSGGGHDSGWQASPTYTDIDLTPSTMYSYTVKARDKSLNNNETGASSPPLAATTGTAQTSGASSIWIGKQIDLASQNAPASNLNVNLSVNANYQGYAGVGVSSSNALVITNDAFVHPVTAYRFWNRVTATTYGTYAQGGGLVSDISTTDNNGFGTANWIRLWDVTDPGGDSFSSLPNHALGTFLTDIPDAAGSVDISGIGRGSVYFFYGAYRSTPSVGVTMTGSGSAANLVISELHNGDPANNTELYVARVDFINKDGFTTMNFNFLNSNGSGRWGGVVVTSLTPEDDYSSWIGGFSGLGGATGFGDDPDGDGLANGLENHMGTHPGTSNQGLVPVATSGNTFTFSHPLAEAPASDLTAAYKWSTDLNTFHDDGDTANGTTVTFSQGPPSGGMVDVTATISGAVPARLFVLIEVNQQP